MTNTTLVQSSMVLGGVMRRCSLRSHSPRHAAARRQLQLNSSMRSSTTTTHFGFQNVPKSEKETLVKGVFTNVADSYDVMNDVMSLGLHRYWKDQFVAMVGLPAVMSSIRRSNIDARRSQSTSKPGRFDILDVAGGTGDIAFRFLTQGQSLPRALSSGRDELSVTVCDLNPDMLRIGEQRARSSDYNFAPLLDHSQALKFMKGNAQDLPLDSNKFDLYTIAFGLRNVTDVDLALQEAFRVLKPGGRYMCLEFGKVQECDAWRRVYDLYSFGVIPLMGQAIANDRASYQYLVESIRQFETQEDLAHKMRRVGFANVSFVNYTGGIVAIHQGWKPL